MVNRNHNAVESNNNKRNRDGFSDIHERASLTRRSLVKLAGAAGATGLLAGQTTPVAADTDSEEFDPIDATIDDVYSAITFEEATAREITETYLDRIEAYDDVLNTVITLNDDALDRADELDAEFDESGPVGPLHGVPIVVKDIYNTGDLPTTAGSLSLEDSQPDEDSYYVRKLREAGAIVLAKVNTHEFALGGTTVSSLGGQTRNPYDVKRIPGGSSGGTAAGVAANLAVFGTASDTLGSTRGPATFNNLVGLRPTVGLVSLDGIVPIAGTWDTPGVNTKTVRETALVLDITAGYDPNNPITSRSFGNIPTENSHHQEDSYVDCLSKNGLDGVRIGVYRDYFGTEFDALDEDVEIDDETEEAAGEITEVIDEAIAELDALGATIVDPVSLGPIEEIKELEDTAGVSTNAKRKIDLNEYFDSLGSDAPISSVEELVESGLYVCDIAGSLEGVNEADLDSLDEELRENEGVRNELRDVVLETMAEEEIDVLLYPHRTLPPEKIGDSNIGGRAGLSARADLPAIAIPAGFTKDEYLPASFDLLGPQFSEPKLLKYAYAFEQGTDHRHPPEGFGPLDEETEMPESPEEVDVPIAAEDDC